VSVRDLPGQDVEAVLRVAGVEVTESCHITARAVRLCGPAKVQLGEPAAQDGAREPGLVFDRVCYPADCADNGQSRDVTITDGFGTRSAKAKGTSLVCTPAAIGNLQDLLRRASVFGRLEARARELMLSAAIDLEMCGDFNSDGTVSASDALGILRAAVGSSTCLPCVCDVDDSGLFSATDALAALRFVTGILSQLSCQPDGNPVTWDGGGLQDVWHDPLNWSLDTRIPNACDDVGITTGSVATVDHSQGNNAALRVTSRFPLLFSGGTLNVRDTVKVDNVLTFRGGTLAGATVLPGEQQLGLDAPNVLFTSNNGTLDGVTMEAPMDMTASSALVRVTNDLVLNNTATLGSAAQIMFQAGTNTLSGTGEVVFSSVSTGYVNQTGNPSALTIAPGMLIHGKAGRVGSNAGGVTLVNQGTIASDEPGNIDVRGGAGWTNEGTLSASGGGNLRLYDTWTNESTIEITGGGTLTGPTTARSARPIRRSSSTASSLWPISGSSIAPAESSSYEARSTTSRISRWTRRPGTGRCGAESFSAARCLAPTVPGSFIPRATGRSTV